MSDEQRRDAWLQLENESEQSHAAFLLYRDMGRGQRSLSTVAEKCCKSGGLIERWSAQHKWVARVRSWDEAQQIAKDEAEMEERRQMGRRHAQQAVVLQSKMLIWLQSFDFTKMTPDQAINLITKAIEIERVARGEAGARIEVRTGKAEETIKVYDSSIDMDLI